MTTTEKVCFYQGVPAPNMDEKSGIHYGVIHSNNVDPWSLDDIYTSGTDLGYESAKQDFKDSCLSVANILKRDNIKTEEDVLEVIDSYFADYDRSSYEADIDYIHPNTVQDVADDLYNYFNDQWQDSMSCAESGPYRYESDGYIIETCSDGDLFVLKSKYYTLCRECSPCASNAGYLTSEGGMKSYCLGHDWFEGNVAPYKVFRVDNDEEVFWWDFIYEDWREKLEKAGFHGAQIYFSGFWNQGDGACFDAECNTDDLVKDLDPKFKQLHSDVDITISIQSNSYANHYSHERTRYIDIDIYKDNITPDQDSMLDELQAIIEQKRLDLCRAIYKDLENEYEYRTSDEALIEDAEANEWTFNEQGRMERE